MKRILAWSFPNYLFHINKNVKKEFAAVRKDMLAYSSKNNKVFAIWNDITEKYLKISRKSTSISFRPNGLKNI